MTVYYSADGQNMQTTPGLENSWNCHSSYVWQNSKFLLVLPDAALVIMSGRVVFRGF